MKYVCHEFAHAITFYKGLKVKHDKKHAKEMTRLIKYCKSKNYFNMQKIDMQIDLNASANEIVSAIIGDKQ